jgi:hypothetical protein
MANIGPEHCSRARIAVLFQSGPCDASRDIAAIPHGNAPPFR